MFTCLQHFINADGGTLPGAICRILPVALNSGKTSMNTATETIHRHTTPAFSTLREVEGKNGSRCREKIIMEKSHNRFIYPNERSQEASINPALQEK
jgi:hypothetical protein